MKEKDVHCESDHQLICYVEKDNGSYGPVQTGSYFKEKYFDDYLAKRQRLEESYAEKLCNGEISPIEYYSVLIDIGEGELARRLGISKHRVKKHKDPSHFARIKLPLLQKYSEIFRIPLANMFQVFISKKSHIKIVQRKTQNPALVVTNAEEEESE